MHSIHTVTATFTNAYFMQLKLYNYHPLILDKKIIDNLNRENMAVP